MTNKKATFITIIVLLCIFAPLTIIGIINQNGKNMLEENPNHEFSYKGHLWFYDNENTFLSKYECLTKVCELSSPTIDDLVYDINYYKAGTTLQVPVIDNKYTFVTDGELIYLYDVENGISLQSYKSLKNYNTKIVDNSFIVQNSNGVWGVLTLNGSGLSNPVKFEYDFIGLLNRVNAEGTLLNDKYIVKKDNKWYLINNENSAITGYIDDPIIDYTSDYVISKNGDKIRIYSYENYEYLTNYNIKDYVLIDKYIGVITDKFVIVYDNLGNDHITAVSIVDKPGKVTLELNNNQITVKVNDEVIESIEVN